MKSISKNRKASHDYFIEEVLETGIVLRGSEVKVLRCGHGSLAEGYAIIRDGEMWLINMYIPTLQHASYMNHSERRERKLLANRREIDKLDAATSRRGYTLVPLELYFNDKNCVKLKLGLGRGKAAHDKRSSEKAKDAHKEIRKVVTR